MALVSLSTSKQALFLLLMLTYSWLLLKVRLHGDRDLIQQAVANLLDNAVKFSPAGGVVRLRAIAAHGGVEISIADQGPGIPPGDRERVTERFFRGETARNTPGAGLGLALVQAVAQLHGGRLRLDDAAPGVVAVLSLATHDDASGAI